MAKTYKVVKNTIKNEKDADGKKTGFQVKNREIIKGGLTWAEALEYKHGDKDFEIVEEQLTAQGVK